MGVEYKIHPPIGVARLGNSGDFYLSPIKIGGRPIECTEFGDECFDAENGKFRYVKKFKDKQKRVKKQAAKFRIFKHDSSKTSPEEIDLSDTSQIKNVKWTVHLANKKAAWFHFSEFKGDLMLGEDNTYEGRKDEDAEWRNKEIKGDDRNKLIVDFGPRTVNSPKMRLKFMNNDQKGDYKISEPKYSTKNKGKPLYGKRVNYLGEVICDSKKNLVVLGGHGNSGGDELFATFAGGETWYDDISDGPVICEITLADDSKIVLDAWVIVGPPKFAPELVNITTLDDTMRDVAIYHLEAAPDIYTKKNGWNPDYIVNFKRDIEPIIKSIGCYRWVANVPSMMDFCIPHFDLQDNSPENLTNRQTYFNYFRKSGENYWGIGGQSNQLFSNKDDYLNGIPLMPLNAGSNSVSNRIVDKFVELSRTQYYFLKQWSEGKFTTEEPEDILGLSELDHADLGNCAGAPLCPGIEVTWNIKNPSIFEDPYKIKHRNKNQEGKFDSNFYFEHGLSYNWDETAPIGKIGGGCEPGDLTKRMADPWVSDLFECNVNHINFTDADRALTAGHQLEEPPTYLAYWWPPQAPWDVILGVTDSEITDIENKKEKAKTEIEASGASAGQQVNFIRGVHNHIEMVYAWSYLGFIVNQNEDENREDYPYFVEKERNHEEFEVSAVSVANKRNIVDPFGVRFEHGYHLKKDLIQYSKDGE